MLYFFELWLQPEVFMKKLLSILILACCAFLCFSQSVKPYAIDLSKFPAVSEDKGVTFDKSTKTFTIKQENGRIHLWLNYLNISDYNIIKVNYKILGDYGFVFGLDYGNDKIEWYTRETYCPKYLTEMEIPLQKGEKKLNGIFFMECGVFLLKNQMEDLQLNQLLWKRFQTLRKLMFLQVMSRL